MTLQHSKTWPVNTMAVVQLRVDPSGRAYSTFMDAESANSQTPRANNNAPHQEKSARDSLEGQVPEVDVSRKGENGVVLPLSTKHLEIFTKMSVHPYKATIRTDTVSTILEHDFENEFESQLGTGKYILRDNPNKNRDESASVCEKFHVLALSKIEETIDEAGSRNMCRRPSIKVDNWDLVYTETNKDTCQNRSSDSAVTTYGCKPKSVTTTCKEHADCLLPDLPLDARKVTTLRRHYYPEGGWGWVIVVCSVLVHVLNNGLQLSCSQLVLPAAGKFKTLPVHVAGECFSY